MNEEQLIFIAGVLVLCILFVTVCLFLLVLYNYIDKRIGLHGNGVKRSLSE